MSNDLVKRLRSGPINIPLANEAADRITALEEENKRLREALEPFSGKYRPEQDWSDDLKIAGTPFQYGDFRRAAAALEKK